MPIYEYQCRKCEEVLEEYSHKPHEVMEIPCTSCGGTADRVYSLSTPKIFDAFTTRNILPGGEPVTVRSTSQLRQLEAEHKVKMTDADYRPPETKVGQ